MFWPIFLIVTCVKILFIPSYRQLSPITSKSLKEMRWHLLSGQLTSRFTATGWPSPTARSCRAGIGRSPACHPGHSTTLLTLLTLNTSCLLLQGYLKKKIVSEWTLTICLSFIDPGMLDVRNLNFASESTILFQRLTVITTDLVFALGAKQCSEVNINYHFPIRMFLMFSLVTSYPRYCQRSRTRGHWCFCSWSPMLASSLSTTFTSRYSISIFKIFWTKFALGWWTYVGTRYFQNRLKK